MANKKLKPAKPKTNKKPKLAKAPKIFKLGKTQPEETLHSSKHKKPSPKLPIKQTKSWLSANLGTILAIILAFACLIFLVLAATLYLKQQNDKQFYSEIEQRVGLKLQEVNELRSLIGTKEQLQTEIVNYQSAPSDLQQFVLRDFAIFKSKCIVNGQYVGPTTYVIENVVYDSYAKILMECEGQDSQIIAKVGGKWVAVHAGQAAPNCNDVNSLAIPQGVAATCTDGKVLYPNPNP